MYTWLAVWLNDVFLFRKDPHISSMLAALAFCSTLILRLLGALLLGHMGDYEGRKVTIVIAT
jgi:MFS family permease